MFYQQVKLIALSNLLIFITYENMPYVSAWGYLHKSNDFWIVNLRMLGDKSPFTEADTEMSWRNNYTNGNLRLL